MSRCKPNDKERYQRLVGKLIYSLILDQILLFAVSMASQHMHPRKEAHMEAAYKILRYLKSSLGKGLFFKEIDSKSVEVFTYANWTGSIKDRRLTTGYCTYIWGNLVTWWSKKQNAVARSTGKAEFRAAA